MSLPPEGRSRIGARIIALSSCIALAAVLSACGGSTRRASTPHSKTTTTAATIAPRIERLVVAERGSISMVARDGCMATVRSSESEAGSHDELRVRCPKPERLNTWFDGAEKVAATLTLEPMAERAARTGDDDDDDDRDLSLPAAKLLTATGRTLKVTKPAEIEKLAAEVRTLGAELATAEQVTPGPASPEGWQMLHVAGAAHVLFAGTPARGVLEAKMSTNGQYLCEFVTNVGDGPMRATKSGWLSPALASRAIDEVLGPFSAMDANEKPRTTYAAGMKAGAEQRSNAASTAAVFERFAEVQDALGDACLPELEAPPASQIGL
jgi:hypothetical protein